VSAVKPKSEPTGVTLGGEKDPGREEAAPEPQTYEEALAGADSELWMKAMDEEFALLLENGTWELEELPDGFRRCP
jgi:hypothetical protein